MPKARPRPPRQRLSVRALLGRLNPFARLRIAQRLPLTLIGLVLVTAVGIGVPAYLIANGTVQTQREEALRAAVHAAYDKVSDYFALVESDLKLTAERTDTINAFGFFASAYAEESFGGAAAAALQAAYVSGNPNADGARQKLLSADRPNNSYDRQHGRHHPAFRALLEARGYADVLLIDPSGVVLYSTAKQGDFGTSIADAGTPLAAVFTKAKSLPAGVSAFVDFATYAPSAGAPRAFAATGVFKDNALAGVLAVAIDPSALSNRIGTAKGLGRTGEVLVVGSDDTMRVDSFFTPENDVLATRVDPAVIAAAINGTGASGASGSYRGLAMMAADLSFAFKGVKWRIVAVQAVDEVMAPLVTMRNTVLAVGAAVLLLALAFGFIFSRSITRPMSKLTAVMGGLAAGRLDLAVPGAGRRDELGAMARAVEVFRENGVRVNEMTEEEQAAAMRRREERALMMGDLQRAFGAVVDAAVAGDFSRRVDSSFPDEELNALARSVNGLVETVERGLGETAVVLGRLAEADLGARMEGDYAGAFAALKADTNAVADKLAEVVGELRSTSRALKAATGEILSGANDLSERTTRQAATIEETSAAMEQLSAIVTANADKAREASSNAAAVTRTAEDGGSVMAEATQAMERIKDSSGKISNIIGLIDDIAFQTNLLALNASVEAARAGEAGKGFAVVAVEVRRLAQSAAVASRDVKTLIDASAGEVRTGSRLVEEAAGKLGAMLGAARSNHALMETIARQSREQASSIEEVNTAVRTLDEMTQHNAALVEQTNAAIEQTEAQANALDRIVDIFTLDEVVEPVAPLVRNARRVAGGPTAAPAPRPRPSLRTAGNVALEADWQEF